MKKKKKGEIKRQVTNWKKIFQVIYLTKNDIRNVHFKAQLEKDQDGKEIGDYIKIMAI